MEHYKSEIKTAKHPFYTHKKSHAPERDKYSVSGLTNQFDGVKSFDIMLVMLVLHIVMRIFFSRTIDSRNMKCTKIMDLTNMISVHRKI